MDEVAIEGGPPSSLVPIPTVKIQPSESAFRQSLGGLKLVETGLVVRAGCDYGQMSDVAVAKW
jgi:hypothetical protein